MKRGKMLRIGFVLFTIINAYALARHTSESLDISEFWEQQLPINDPMYPPSPKHSFATIPIVPLVTTTGHNVDTDLSTTEKSTVAETVVPSTALAGTLKANSSWWSNIFSGVVPAYRKLTYYIGPYLLPSLLATSVIGVISTLVCSYTSVCGTVLSMLGSNMREVRRSLTYTLIPYISPDKLDCLASTVKEAVEKFSDAQNNAKTE